MKNFLARLVDRARGTAPRVEPIIAPRFAQADSLGSELLPEISSEIEALPMVRTSTKPKPVLKQTQPRDEKKSPASSANGHDKDETATEIVTERLLVPQVPERSESLVVRQTEADGPQIQVRAGQEMKRSLEARALGKTQPNESKTEPPIVRVTIGRIDVRAAPAPAPPRKPARPAGPTLTLEAYLKERKEGRR